MNCWKVKLKIRFLTHLFPGSTTVTSEKKGNKKIAWFCVFEDNEPIILYAWFIQQRQESNLPKFIPKTRV